jgi:vancomycin permeability regulator SanA
LSLLALVAVLGIVAAAAAVASAVVTWARISEAGRAGPVPVGDVVVVFGAEARADGPSPELQARLERALELYRQGSVEAILCSGGRTGRVSEAQTMQVALLKRGVPAEAIFVDETGCSTRCTIKAVAKQGAGRWARALLVSSPYHIHRIVVEARRQRLSFAACPTAPTPVMGSFPSRLRYQIREVAATWWYALTALLAGLGHSARVRNLGVLERIAVARARRIRASGQIEGG